MHSVAENIKVLNKKWGPEAWTRVVVFVISDGRSKIHQGTLDCLGAMGVVQESAMQGEVAGHAVTGHIFEYTSQVDWVDKGDGKGIEAKTSTPIQIVFCLKEKNAKKINSHRWFFQVRFVRSSFARRNRSLTIVLVRVTIMLDVGTRPSANSFYNVRPSARSSILA